MNEGHSIGESAPRDAPPRAPLSPLRRLAALLALLALLASAALSSWWILTDRADFSADGDRGARSEDTEGER